MEKQRLSNLLKNKEEAVIAEKDFLILLAALSLAVAVTAVYIGKGTVPAL